ncbi:MAG: CCA tRNA nucleotidyltransferase [Planctomycetota bacterium]|jgi:tRNA nucleotidyltransferase/poly(A) polymerase
MTNKQAAIEIIKRLRSNGFEALLAGGCVRDMLLGKRAKDYDIATTAAPKDVIKLFKRTLKVGAKFGVIIVLIKGRQIEVATFRTEADYADGRHPGKVEFVGAAEDASRRDFTINGMFYDPVENKVIDYVAGQADLKKRLIRTIGKPNERFGEDYLRMLRVVRFSTRLGFKIEPETLKAVRSNAANITKISGERIAMELEAILVGPNRSEAAAIMNDSGLSKSIFPGFKGKHAKFAVDVLTQLPKRVDFALALAGFFAGFSTTFAVEGCRLLKLSRNHNRHIKFLLTYRGTLLKGDMSLAELKKIAAQPYFWDLYELQKAIEKSTPAGSITPLVALRKKLKDLGDIDLQPKPLLNGHDLMRLGAVAGRGLGQLAEEMYIAQLEGVLQTKQQAKQWVSKWLEKHKDI